MSRPSFHDPCATVLESEEEISIVHIHYHDNGECINQNSIHILVYLIYKSGFKRRHFLPLGLPLRKTHHIPYLPEHLKQFKCTPDSAPLYLSSTAVNYNKNNQL